MNLSILYKKLTNRKYTIGYKFILSLFVGFVGIISFCSADSLVSTFSLGCVKSYCNVIQRGATSYNLNTYFFVNLGDNSYFSFDNSSISQNVNVRIFYHQLGQNPFWLNTDVNNISSFNSYTWCQNKSNCDVIDGVQLIRPYTYTSNFIMTGFIYFNGTGSCTSQTCPEVDTGSILSGYVPESDLLSCQISLSGCQSSLNTCQSDYNTCQSNTSGFNDLLNSCSNNLNACNNSLSSCLQQNCPETVTGTNRSSLFINNIQYPGAPTIKFTIPEEIEREQNTDEEETNIDVIGYGYDQDKMQQMVNTQYYKPTAEEMSGLIEKVAEFLPLVAIALLIIRIRRILKKVFKF